jgi:uncharacterized protein YjbI with pentapeptide repeats
LTLQRAERCTSHPGLAREMAPDCATVRATAQFTIRGTSADLPALDGETVLQRVRSLAGGSLSGFEFGEASLREVDLKDVTWRQGAVRALRAERAERASMTALDVRSAEFTGCELGSLRWTGGKLARGRFDGCKLLGARFADVTMNGVVFTDCKLDYAVFDQVRAGGPVLFARCSLREAVFTGCHLAGCLFDECDLFAAEFGPGTYRGCDLRGNDLSAISGTHHLKNVVLDRVQVLQLADALSAELGVTFTGEAVVEDGQGEG